MPPQENKTGSSTPSSSVHIPSSPVQRPIWPLMNSTSSCWSEAPAYWPVLPFPSNHFDSVVLAQPMGILILKYVSHKKKNYSLSPNTAMSDQGGSTKRKQSLILILNPFSGLESPTHALRADADPSAQSASATYITLAQEHPYDRHIEIILHLSGETLKTFLQPCFVISLFIHFLICFTICHRTPQPTGHHRERETILQPV